MYTARFAPEKLMVGRFPSLSFWGSACGFLGRINDPAMYRERLWECLSPVQLDLSTFSVETSQLPEWKKRVLGGGFKHFLFSPLPGEMIQFD